MRSCDSQIASSVPEFRPLVLGLGHAVEVDVQPVGQLPDRDADAARAEVVRIS